MEKRGGTGLWQSRARKDEEIGQNKVGWRITGGIYPQVTINCVILLYSAVYE